jgi:hypothetical protein
MDLSRFTRVDETTWRIEPHGAMRVPAIIYADEKLMRDMDDKVYEQAVNVAMLPGIVQASYAMPDAHWGYGFPIGGTDVYLSYTATRFASAIMLASLMLDIDARRIFFRANCSTESASTRK